LVATLIFQRASGRGKFRDRFPAGSSLATPVLHARAKFHVDAPTEFPLREDFSAGRIAGHQCIILLALNQCRPIQDP